MSYKEVTFYFFRHGLSCTNLLHKINLIKYIKNIYDKKYRDPHIVNWGIIGSILSGKYIKENIIKNIIFDHVYVSPLLRTWETLTCMFPDIKKFEVAPYLREGISKKKIISSTFFSNIYDTPYSLSTNIIRYNNFVHYLQNNTLMKILQKKNIYIENSIQKHSYKKYKKTNVQNTKIHYSPSFIKKNKKDNYNNDMFDNKGDIYKFITWCKEHVKDKENILTICHGTILLADFIKEYICPSEFKKIRHIRHNNNYGFKVKVRYYKDKIAIKPTLLYNGFYIPSDDILSSMSLDCSLCYTDFKKYSCNTKEETFYNDIESYIQEN